MATFLTIDDLNLMTKDNLEQVAPEKFREVLTSCDRVRQWPKITPVTLSQLPTPHMEVLLDLLPQCGAIRDREAGKLRVLSMGFNVHVGGTDKRCPFPIDFCVRVNGHQAAVNVLIRPAPEVSYFIANLKRAFETGPKLILGAAFRYFASKGLRFLNHYELVYLPMYRPASQSGIQIGTVGGTFEAEDTAEGRLLQETKEEFKGFQYLAWDLLLHEQVYQSGNIFELQSIGAVLGHIPDERSVEVQKSEGIAEWKTVRLSEALRFLQENPDHDAKIDHGLRVLLPQMADWGVH